MRRCSNPRCRKGMLKNGIRFVEPVNTMSVYQNNKLKTFTFCSLVCQVFYSYSKNPTKLILQIWEKDFTERGFIKIVNLKKNLWWKLKFKRDNFHCPDFLRKIIDWIIK